MFVLSHRLIIASVLTLLLSGCQYFSADSQSATAETVVAGQILDVKRMALVSQDELISKLKQSEIILLGERHDNQYHHELQSLLITQIAASYQNSSVSFEMIDNEQASIIGDLQRLSLDELIKQLTKTSNAWNYEKDYKPVLAAALNNQLAIYPANIELQRLRAFMMQEPVALGSDIEHWLQNTELDPEQQALITEEMVSSHCGMLDSAAAAPMVTVQRARDIAMALSLVKSTADRRFLIAGTGHVRTDRGAPYYLQEIAPELSVVSLAFVEVEADDTKLDFYQQFWDSDNFPFDYVWFTKSTARSDPCEAFKTAK